VPGAEVSLLSPGAGFGLGGTATAVTDEGGDYRLLGVPKGKHLLIVKAAGYFQEEMAPTTLGRAFTGSVDHPAGVEVAASQDEVRKDLEVMPGAMVTGTVLSPDGRPVRGARVGVAQGDDQFGVFMSMMGVSTRPVLTDPEGGFRLTVPAGAGSATLAASADGFVEGRSDPVAVSTGAEVEGVVIRLRAGASVAGSVFGEDGAPVKGAVVRVLEIEEGVDTTNEWTWRWRLRQAEAHLVDEDGGFRVEGLKPGRAILAAEAPGHQEVVLQGLTLSEGSTLSGQVVRLPKGLAIAGIVTDEGGAPIAGARVSHASADGSMSRASWTGGAPTDAKGRFEIDRLRAGNYNLTASADGRARVSVGGVAAGTKDVRIVMPEGRSIEGRVVQPDGSAAARVRVWANKPDGSSNGWAQTDEEGKFKIDGLGPGPHNLGARSSDPKHRQVQVEGIQAGTRGVEIRLETGLTITGKVVDHDGNPVAGVGVVARPQGGEGRPQGWAQTDEQGNFTVGGLDEGDYEIHAMKNIMEGGNPQMLQAKVKVTGSVTEVMIQLPPPK
jgi:protocatechuate 3,4-dioxygenase beta subunit